MILPLIAYAVVVGLVLAAMGAVLERVLVLRRLPRRWVWAAVLGANLLLTMTAPWRSHQPAATASASARMDWAVASNEPFAHRHWFDRLGLDVDAIERVAARFDPIAGFLWVVGSTAMGVMYAAGLWTLSRRRRCWRETRFHEMRIFVASKDGPAVVGVWKPRIVVPEWALGLEPHAVDLMLDHEREHQRAADPLLLHTALIVLAAMPWNPAAWWMLSRLKLAVEMDCDARVLGRDAGASIGHDVGIYSELLLAVATRQSPEHFFVTPAMLERPSTLRRRIAAMYPNRLGLTLARLATAWVTAAALLAIVTLVPAPGLRAQSTGPSVGSAPLETPTGAVRGPAAPAAQEQVYEIGNGVMPPVPTRQVDPEYTSDAKRAKIQGEVQLQGIVTTKGVLDQIRVIKSLDTVHGLDRAAVDAAKKWTFKPGTKDGKPVPVRVELVMEFRLH